MAAAAAAIGRESRRVFLAIGRLQLAAFEAAPQHFYLIRSIEPIAPNLPHHRIIAARGPFDTEAEERLLRDEKIDVIVAKNSGAAAVFGKIIAARRLRLPVIMVARPPDEASGVGARARTATEALALILAHGARPALRSDVDEGAPKLGARDHLRFAGADDDEGRHVDAFGVGLGEQQLTMTCSSVRPKSISRTSRAFRPPCAGAAARRPRRSGRAASSRLDYKAR